MSQEGVISVKKGLSQETLKLIACITMLIDHIGAAFIPDIDFRIVGRLSFPIYCFLLAEGIHHTKNPFRYGLRLLLSLLLSELPFDILFYGHVTFAHQSVMVTLFMAYLLLCLLQRVSSPVSKVLLCLGLSLAAELLSSDYGGIGVLMVVLFALTRDIPFAAAVRLVGLLLLNWMLPSAVLGNFPIQLFATAALLPIEFYSGKKATHSKIVQWSFYAFYPVHLALLALIKIL